MTTQADAITPLTRDALDRATMTLARAFSRDPMFEWMLPDPQQRLRALEALNRVPLEYGLRYGHTTTSHDGGAVSVWLPPGRSVTIPGMLRSGMLRVLPVVGVRPFGRFMRANAVMERIHKQHVPEPHWYLLVVAVDPALQGRGLGAALIREGLARADAAQCPCYLETSHERNVAFYERHGFRILATAALGRHGPLGWGMRREADVVKSRGERPAAPAATRR